MTTPDIHLRLELTEAAHADLRAIYLYGLETWGEAQADSYQTRLEQALSLLAAQPRLGRSKDTFFSGCRLLTVAQHEIAYVIRDDRIDVLRVLPWRIPLECHRLS